jgi:hypothetical protein
VLLAEFTILIAMATMQAGLIHFLGSEGLARESKKDASSDV